MLIQFSLFIALVLGYIGVVSKTNIYDNYQISVAVMLLYFVTVIPSIVKAHDEELSSNLSLSAPLYSVLLVLTSPLVMLAFNIIIYPIQFVYRAYLSNPQNVMKHSGEFMAMGIGILMLAILLKVVAPFIDKCYNHKQI